MKRILICIIDSPEENWANQTFKNSNRILPEKKKTIDQEMGPD